MEDRSIILEISIVLNIFLILLLGVIIQSSYSSKKRIINRDRLAQLRNLKLYIPDKIYYPLFYKYGGQL